jgi:hypothetical protein
MVDAPIHFMDPADTSREVLPVRDGGTRVGAASWSGWALMSRGGTHRIEGQSTQGGGRSMTLRWGIVGPGNIGVSSNDRG